MSKNIVKPLSRQLVSELCRGEYGVPGEVFRTVREIADSNDISLVTAHRVIRSLSAAGLLERSGRNMVLTAKCCRDRPLKKIGVVVSNLDNPFFSRLLNALERIGRKKGIKVLSVENDYCCDYEKTQLQMLAESGVDGFLVSPAGGDSVNTLRSFGKPFVLLGRELSGEEERAVTVNNFEAGRLAAAHLLDVGCRVFFYVGLSLVTMDLRCQGFVSKLREVGIELSESHCLQMNVRPNDNDLKKFITSLSFKEKKGVFCYHDLLALRAIRAARLANLTIPEQVAIVGCDNLPIAAETWPTLSSIGYSIQKLADMAIRNLEEEAQSENVTIKQTHYVEPTLIVRNSSVASNHLFYLP